MKHLAFCLMLFSCSPVQRVPEPFIPTNEKVIVQGCEDLKDRVEQHNQENPDNLRVADC